MTLRRRGDRLKTAKVALELEVPMSVSSLRRIVTVTGLGLAAVALAAQPAAAVQTKEISLDLPAIGNCNRINQSLLSSDFGVYAKTYVTFGYGSECNGLRMTTTVQYYDAVGQPVGPADSETQEVDGYSGNMSQVNRSGLPIPEGGYVRMVSTLEKGGTSYTRWIDINSAGGYNFG